jgi:hypothetical protein
VLWAGCRQASVREREADEGALGGRACAFERGCSPALAGFTLAHSSNCRCAPHSGVSAVGLSMQELVLLPRITQSHPRADHRERVDRTVPVQHLCRSCPVWSSRSCSHACSTCSTSICLSSCMPLLMTFEGTTAGANQYLLLRYLQPFTHRGCHPTFLSLPFALPSFG